MAMDRFFIAPFDKDSGLQTNYKPFLIPDEAFAQLTNAYVFRGRVRKRFGSRWMGDSQLLTRFRMSIGTTDGTGAYPGAIPAQGTVPLSSAVGNRNIVDSSTCARPFDPSDCLKCPLIICAVC